jgi:hypothetical protein
MKGALPFREIHITMEEDAFTAAWSGKILPGRYAAEGDLMLTSVWF